jgi:predicted nuclease of predicted toxin-antitoxin system
MQFKIDENLPAELAELLKQAGHDASTVFEQKLMGAPDSQLAVVCQKEKRTLITGDVGFADIRIYPPTDFYGVIVLRLTRQDKPHVLKIFADAMRLFASEVVKKRLWIIEEGRIRIRD